MSLMLAKRTAFALTSAPTSWRSSTFFSRKCLLSTPSAKPSSHTLATRERTVHTTMTTTTGAAASATAHTDIARKGGNDRFAHAVIHNDIVHLSGIIAPSPERNVTAQTRNVLEQIDDLLVDAGTHKSRILSATVWLSDISRIADMNVAWSEWLDVENKPVRACVEGKLALEDAVVEIQVTAALPARQRVVRTSEAAGAVGPYNQAVVVDNGTVYVSGCIALSAEDGTMIGDGDVHAQCRQALRNLKAIVDEAGCGVKGIVKTMILLADMNDFATVNAVYAEFFEGGPVPARSCFAAKALPKGALVEIEAIAVLERV